MHLFFLTSGVLLSPLLPEKSVPKAAAIYLPPLYFFLPILEYHANSSQLSLTQSKKADKAIRGPIRKQLKL